MKMHVYIGSIGSDDTAILLATRIQYTATEEHPQEKWEVHHPQYGVLHFTCYEGDRQREQHLGNFFSKITLPDQKIRLHVRAAE